MSKQRIYWFCQIVGWTLLIMVEFVAYWLNYGFDLDLFYLAIANILLGIGLTHLYRLTIRRWNWVRLPFFQLAPRVLASVVVLALIMTLINIPFDRALLPELFVNEPSVVIGYMLSWGKTMLTWILSYTAYHYVERTRDAEIEKILLKTSIRETEAKVLRSQLNPHFMFNALNSIRALVHENPQGAQRGITQLSNILRNSLLADRRKTVELREEIKTVEDYLALEKVRYEDRLETRLHIDPQTLYWQVPPMMLQTLVENAIKHGVSKAVGGGFVELTTTFDEGTGDAPRRLSHYVERALPGITAAGNRNPSPRLHICIRNTGVLGDKEESGGFGLKNTAQRLDLLFGPDASFDIWQEEPDVVRADVSIPVQSEGIFKREHKAVSQ